MQGALCSLRQVLRSTMGRLWNRRFGALGAGAIYGRRNLLLSFEHDDVNSAFESIAPHVELIHPVERQAWGQRVFRFYEPDGHAVEVGEPQSTIQPFG